MSPSKPLVYAELLSNIRQISAIVALDTPWNSASKVEVSASGREIIIDHNGETTSLDLPGHVSSNARLQIPVLGSKEVSWRLPLAGPAQHTEDDAQSNGVPWSASSLNEDTEFQCRNCASVLVKSGSIRTWKDLPSENWAEMMDFWHCHKPDLEENGEDRPAGHGNTKNGIASEGYAASSKLRAEPGLGFVDLTTLLFSSTDCMGIQTNSIPDRPIHYKSLICRNCHKYLGYIDQQFEGQRLYKWQLILSALPTAALSYPTPPSISYFISSQLLSIINSQCTSRILLSPTPTPSYSTITHSISSSSTSSSFSPSKNSISSASNSSVRSNTASRLDSPSYPSSFLSIWVFNKGLRFSSTFCTTSVVGFGGKGKEKGILAMKVFWTELDEGKARKLVDNDAVEELSLPNEAIIEIRDVLRDSAGYLPPSGRKFQHWEVGLLERFEGQN